MALPLARGGELKPELAGREGPFGVGAPRTGGREAVSTLGRTAGREGEEGQRHVGSR